MCNIYDCYVGEIKQVSFVSASTMMALNVRYGKKPRYELLGEVNPNFAN